MIKKLLEWLGLSETVKACLIHRQYNSYYKTRSAEKKFYSQFGRMNLIFDIGANKGNKTGIFCSLSKSVVSIDPDEKNFKILQSRFANNKKVKIEKVAVSDSDGKANFFLLDDGEELNTMSEKWKEVIEQPENTRFNQSRKFSKNLVVETTTLDLLVAKYGTPDYIKIDVEGFELKVISGLHKPVPLLSFEANLPEFLEETLLCIDKLKELKSNTQFNFSVDCKMILSDWVNAAVIKTKIKNCASGTIEVYGKTE